MNAERPSWLCEVIESSAATLVGDAEASTFLSVAFHVAGQAQGAVHVAVSAVRATKEEATRFARALEDAAKARHVVLRAVWHAVTHGPHEGDRQGAVVCAIELLETPKVIAKLHVKQTLAAAQKLSEESVLAIGNELRNMQQLAVSQVDGLKRVAAQFSDSASGAHDATVATTIEQLASQMRTFGETILERTQRQARDIEQARVWTADIVRLGQAIATIAGDARILTFNARLEAARIGEAGRGFNVIATSIQDLASQVRSTNESVANLAHSLARALPRLGADANDTSKSTREAVSQLETQLQAVQGQLSAVRSQSWEALADSSTVAEDLQHKTNSVIQHLQFQDRASQMLQEAVSQVNAVVAEAGFIEKSVEDTVLEQVGVLGRELAGETASAPGSIELF